MFGEQATFPELTAAQVTHVLGHFTSLHHAPANDDLLHGSVHNSTASDLPSSGRMGSTPGRVTIEIIIIIIITVIYSAPFTIRTAVPYDVCVRLDKNYELETMLK